MRILAAVLLGLTLTSILGGCYVQEGPRCPYGWVPEHRDERGRLVGGHCR
jgi:hypothetical protein